MYFNLVKIFMPTAVAFFLGLFFTPFATHFFYKYKMWKKYSRSIGATNSDFQKINNEKEELKTPRVGGIIIWISVLTTVLIFYLVSIFFPGANSTELNFLSRNQTLIPLFTLLIGSLIGLWDDFIQIYGTGKFARDDKSWRKWKIFIIAFMSLFIGLWFFYKLGLTSIHIPFAGVITGAILAFLWFNIPPARFYMGETGIMGLTLTLATLAFLTDSVLILPVVALPLVLTSLSVILQIASKKLRGGKRLFRLAPLHHHFEAIGWSPYKVTMRFWIFSTLFAIIGIILAVISR